MRDHPLVGFHLHAKPMDANRGAMQPALAFIDLIMECRYEDGAVMNGGQKMQVRRGELVGAISYLAARWNWTPKAVRGWLDRLEADGMIARFQRLANGEETGLKKGNQSGNQAALIRLCNYEIYQSTTEDDWQSQGQSKGNQGAIEGQSKGNNNKDNKETKEQGNKIDNPSDLPPVGGDNEPKRPTVRDVAREAFAEWQEFAKIHGLPVPRDTSFDAFAAKIAQRIQEHADAPTREAMLRVWRLALACVAKSKHCRGENDRGWRADIEFLCRREKFAKLISGSYGNGACAIDARWSVAGGSHASRPDWSSWDDDEWQHQIEKHGVEYWPVDKLAGPPGSKTYVGPKAMESSLCEVYRPDGMRRQR